MNDFEEIAYDGYIMELHQYNTFDNISKLLIRALSDTDLSKRSFRRLLVITLHYMDVKGIKKT